MDAVRERVAARYFHGGPEPTPVARGEKDDEPSAGE